MGPNSEFDHERVCLENATWLRELARALVGDVHAADDIVQDALGAAVRRSPDARDVRAYLAGTVRHLASKWRREIGRRTARERTYGEERAVEAGGTEDVLERMDLMRRVLEEVESLPRTEGRVIGLRYVDGLTVEEIAARTSLASSSVRSALSRGLGRLRGRFDRSFGGRGAWAPFLVSMTRDGPGEAVVHSSVATAKHVLTSSGSTCGGTRSQHGSSHVIEMDRSRGEWCGARRPVADEQWSWKRWGACGPQG